MTSPSGVLLVDKPPGPTSHDLVDRVRRVAGTRRVGHAGTLDPFASGLLVLLLGQATRLSEYLLGMEKEYEAVARVGSETSTHDPEGEVVREDPGWRDLSRGDLERALAPLRGRIAQVPPAFSAKKVRGEAAHRRVRRGEEVELEAVEVEIHELEILGVDLPDVRMAVRCSSGTYIRALARDFGRALGVGAHLTALRRTAIGPFRLSEAASATDVENDPRFEGRLISPADALAHLPTLVVGREEALRLRQGQRIRISGNDLPEGEPVRILLDGDLLAIGARQDDHVRPRKVLAHG